MNARTQLSDALKDALPAYRVIGFNADLDGVAKPTLMLWASHMQRPDDFGLNRVRVTFDVWVLVGQENSGTADNALDVALEKTLGALQPLPWIEWTEAERGVLFEKFHGWKVTAVAVATIDDEGA